MKNWLWVSVLRVAVPGKQVAICHASIAVVPYVGLEVLTAENMKNSVFWDITPCSLLKVKRRCRRIYFIDLQRRRISQARNSANHLLRTGFLPYLFFAPEDGKAK
jgi:hypothetical protein